MSVVVVDLAVSVRVSLWGIEAVCIRGSAGLLSLPFSVFLADGFLICFVELLRNLN